MNDPVPSTPLRRLAHELRNAIAPARNAAHLLRKRAPSDPTIAAALATIDSAIDRSLRLLESAVDAERVLAGSVSLASDDVDVRAVAQRAVQQASAAIADKHQQIRVALPAEALNVRGDADRLAQIVSTLIDNASRYSGSGADIEVVVDARDDNAIVRVRDHGQGMAPARVAAVFEPNGQSDDARSGSAVMSLPVARRLAEMHGGRLEATSDGQNRGSEFVVTLPRIDVRPDRAPAQPTASATPHAAIAGTRVLLVDDNRAVRETYADVLEEIGCDVDTAADGEQAIARATEWRPRFVVLDINLPKKNGYDVARALRARFTADEMTLVMISGTGLDASTLAMARAAGFDHCLDKASDVAALERLLGGR